MFSRKIKISKFVLTALGSSVLSIVPVQSSYGHGLVDTSNIAANVGTIDGSLFVATKLASTAVAHTGAAVSSGHADARSTSLFYKDTTSGSAQTVTMLTGGLLSLYAQVSTTSAVSATSGRMYGAPSQGYTVQTDASAATGIAFLLSAAASGTATAIGAIFQAPSTATTVTLTFKSANQTAAATPSSNNYLLGTTVTTLTITVLGSTNLSTSHFSANSTDNHAVVSGPVDASLMVATKTNETGTSAAPSAARAIEGTGATSSARSVGLLSKDSTFGTAQTVTMLTSGKLALYANISTTVAFTSTAGTFSGTTQGSSAATITYSDPAATTLVVLTSGQYDLGATAVGTLWNAPSSAGTYTISLYRHSGTAAPTLTSPAQTLSGQITVTVVATSAGGSYSAPYSVCATKTSTTTATALTGTAAVDSTSSSVINGNSWYVGFILNDAYVANLSDGSLVATVTGGAVVNMDEDGDANSASLAAGTAATIVQYGNGNAGLIRISQGTAGAPVTSTLTLTYNGTTVCTKTVKILGAAATVEVSDIATVDLSGSTTNVDWHGETAVSGSRAGHYYVTLKDSAGNIVYPATGDAFSMDPTTTTTTVTALAVAAADFATSTSSTIARSKSMGTFTCGPTAGQSSVKIRHTTAATGVTITSPAFVARCADDPYTYTASFDKASYVQGEVATLTVKFLDSKGNPANSLDTPGAATFTTPMLTAVDATGSATVLPNKDGVKTYTFTVGTPSGMTAGTYTAIIDFTSLTAVAATKQTPTYKVGAASTDITFTEVLKSVVALIASINKQIQALQKLILKR